MTDIELEVDKTLWENKHISLVEDLCEELVARVGGNEADVECTLNHNQDLGGSGVSVGRVESVGSEVDASQGNAEGVETSELVDRNLSHLRTEPVVRVSGLVETLEEEIFGFHHVRVFADEPIHKHCIDVNVLLKCMDNQN